MFRGLPFIGKLNEFLGDVLYATLSKIGSSKAGIDVVNYGYFAVNDPSTKLIAEVGSTDGLLVLTGHTAKVGDKIMFAATANNINEQFMTVDEIIDANTMKLAGYASADIVAGDTFDLYRPVVERFAPDGSTLATVQSAPVRYNVVAGASTTQFEVTDNQDTPNLSAPLPVQLFGANGTLSVTSDTIDVNLSHNGAQQDSVAIGNGSAGSPRFWEINATSGAGLVEAVDLDIRNLNHVQDNVAISSSGNTLAINASGEAAIDKSLLATEEKQDDTITAVGAVETEITSLHNDIGDVADAEETDSAQSGTLIAFTKGIVNWLSSIRTRLDSPISAAQSGVWTVGVNNFPADPATATLQGTGNTSLSNIDTNTTNLEARLDTLISTLNTLNAKLPAIGTQVAAASQSVTLASDEPAIETSESINTNGTSANVALNNSGSSFVPPANAVGFVLKNIANSDEAVYWSLGAAATVNDSDLLPAQGTAFIPFGGTVYVFSPAVATVNIQWVRR